MNSLNGELMTDIIEQKVIVYKISPDETKQIFTVRVIDKVYYPGLEISCLVESDPQINIV